MSEPILVVIQLPRPRLADLHEIRRSGEVRLGGSRGGGEEAFHEPLADDRAAIAAGDDQPVP